VIVRKAEWRDLPEIATLVRMHYDSTGFTADVEYDAERVHHSLTLYLLASECQMFVATASSEDRSPAEVDQLMGVLAVQESDTFFSLDRAARELFLYIKPEFRGQHAGVAMIRMAEDWARSKGMQSIIIGNHPLSPPHVAVTYKRHGYREAQTDFIKRL